MVTPLDILEPGGTLIVASACSEGFGSPEFRDAQARLVARSGPTRFLQTLLAKRFADVDEWQTEMQLKSMRVGRVQLYTTGLDAGGAAPHRASSDRLRRSTGARRRALRAHGDPAVAVIPEGPVCRPRRRLIGGAAAAGDRSRSISISSAASPATCSSPRWSTRCRRCERRSLAELDGGAPGERPGARLFDDGDERRTSRAALRPRATTARRASPTATRDHAASDRGERRHAGTASHRGAAARTPDGTDARTRSRCSRSSPRPRRASTASPVDDVHFHELADWDSLLDIVAAGMHRREPRGRALDRVAASRCGGGIVRTAHGLLPVPAPATALLLEGYRVARRRRRRRARHADRRGDPAPSRARRAVRRRRDGGRLVGAGTGAGTRTLARHCPTSCARWSSRRRAADPPPAIEADVVVGARVRRRRHDRRGDRGRRRPPARGAGVIDVSIGARVGKKGRPLADFRVLARPDAADGHRARVLRRNLDDRVCGVARGPAACPAPRRSARREVDGAAIARQDRASAPAAAHGQGGARRRRRHATVSRARRRARRRRGARAEATRMSAAAVDDASRASSRCSTAHRRLAIAVSGGVDSMTLAHVAWRYSRAARDDVPRDGARGAGGGARRASKRMRRAHGWPLVVLDAGEFADARYRANPVDRCYYCKTNLYERIRAATPDADRLGHQSRRSRRLPSRLARRGRARRRASLRRGRHRQGGRLRAGAQPRPRPISSACRRSRASRAASRPASPSRRTTSRSSTPSRRASPRASGSEAVLRCRVTHEGIVIELRRRSDAAARGARARHRCRSVPGGRPHVRRRASVRARRGVSARRRRWMNFASTGTRAARTGTSEAVLCEPKSAAQIDAIVAHAAELAGGSCSRGSVAAQVRSPRGSARSALDYDDAIAHGDPRRAARGQSGRPQSRSSAAARRILPVAREAARTLAFAGEEATLVADVGVAGLWRLMERLDEIRRHRVVIAVAGMEGALFSVLAGLVPCAVIAVPTSVGYGVAEGGADGAPRGARKLRVRPCRRQHRQRLRRRARGAADSRRARDGGLARRAAVSTFRRRREPESGRGPATSAASPLRPGPCRRIPSRD